MITYAQMLEIRERTQHKDAVRSARWTNEQEAKIIMDALVSGNIKYALECGTCNGWMAGCMASAGAQVHTVEIVDGRPRMVTDDLIHYYTGKFADLAPKILEEHVPANTPILVFIDGDHHFQSTLDEYRAVLPRLCKGSKLLFHDCKLRKVMRAIKIVTEELGVEPIIHDTIGSVKRGIAEYIL